MGMLVDGIWRDDTALVERERGRFVRDDSKFRGAVTADGSSGFKAEPGRYHLFVAYSCPWAHRTIIFRRLKQLEGVITMSAAIPGARDHGWQFDPVDALGFSYLHQVYTAAAPGYTGRVTVPTLWDKQTHKIVNNESPEIIRMLNSAFDAFTPVKDDYYPAPLRPAIDAINALVYGKINNGVYRCGFAGTQEAYDEAFDALFAALDEVEALLSRQRYLCGEQLTEADWRLFPTLVRFDAVYHGLFKCNRHRLGDFPHLTGYARELCQIDGVADTVRLDDIKRGYYANRQINPNGIVPRGPIVDFSLPHQRDRLPRAA